MARKNDLTGQKFGKLLAINETEYYTKSGHKQRGYVCLCDCGNKKIVSAYALKSGKTKSCGCIIREFNLHRAKYYYKHYSQISEIDEDVRRRLTNIFKGMRSRCYNPNGRQFKNYGGRGIKICDEWLEDKNKFILWAVENGYKKNLSIDRINVDGDYTPINCRWADKITQANNMRTNTHIYYNGEKYTLAEASRITGVERHALSAIARNGLSLIDNKHGHD